MNRPENQMLQAWLQAFDEGARGTHGAAGRPCRPHAVDDRDHIVIGMMAPSRRVGIVAADVEVGAIGADRAARAAFRLGVSGR
jgi:hypothetical protein